MPTGKQKFDGDEQVEAVEDPLTIIPEEETAQTVYYEPAMWKNIKPVFRCATCGTYRDDEDDMILHVVSHLPADEQVTIFDQLMKKKEK